MINREVIKKSVCSCLTLASKGPRLKLNAQIECIARVEDNIVNNDFVAYKFIKYDNFEMS